MNLTVGLSKNEIQTASLWSLEKEEASWLDFAQCLVYQYYLEKQFFMFVDDLDSIPNDVKKDHKSIEFIKSNELLSSLQ